MHAATSARTLLLNEDEEQTQSKLICNKQLQACNCNKQLQVCSLTRSTMQFACASTGRLQVLPTPAELTQGCLFSRKLHHSSRSHIHTRRAFTDQPAQVDVEDPKVCHPAKFLLPDNACKATPSQWSASGASTNASYARADATARGTRANERSAGPDARQRVCREGRKVEGELASIAAFACSAACMVFNPCLRHHICILSL